MKTRLAEFLKSEKFNLLIVFLLASAVMLPVLFNGVPNGFDMPHHYQCALTYRDSILAGDFYPSWTNLRNLGYGGLEVRLYPPISHYVLALFSFVSENWHVVTWLTYTFWWALGSFGVYFWTREFVSPRLAVAAAVIYAVMPYRLNQAYLVFFYGEVAGSAILPFCFAFLARVLREQKNLEIQSYGQIKNHLLTPNVVGFAVSYAALILTHLPLTLIVSFTLVVYGLANARLDAKYCLSYLSRLAVGGTLALASTSFFWVKVLQERAIMAKTLIYEDIYLNYYLNFLLTPLQTYDSATVVVYDVFTLVYDVILLVTLAAVVPLALLALGRRQILKDQMFRSVWITFALAVFLTTLPSKFVWDNFKLLQEVQFPWRWLSIISLFAPVVAAYGLPVLEKWFRSKWRPLSLIFAGFFCICASFSLSTAIRGAIYTAPSEVTPYVQKINHQEGFKFWWTVWTRKEFLKDNPEKVQATNRKVEINDWQDTTRDFVLDAGEAREARVATFYHPNWKASVNDAPAALRPDPHGAMLLELPAERARVKLFFEETRLVRLGRYASVFCWAFFLLFGVGLWWTKNRNSLAVI